MVCPVVPADCVDAVATSAIDKLADSVADALEWVVKNTVTWWIDVPAVDLANTPVDRIRALVAPLTVLVALAGVIWCGIRMVLSRKADPLVDVGAGLAKLAIVSAVGTVGVNMALRAGDSYSIWVLEQATSGPRSQVSTAISNLFVMTSIPSAGVVILVGIVMVIATFVQAVLMLFREGSIIVLTGVLVFAAAGSFTQATRGGLRKVIAWTLTLVAYKPVAATVYATAFLLMRDEDSTDPRSFFMGAAMLMLSLVALPAMMRFFNWSVGAVADSGGGFASGAAAGAAGIHAAASLTGPGGGAADHARYMSSSLGPVPTGSGGPTGASPSAVGGGPSGGQVAAQAAAAPTPGAAATAGTAASSAAGAGGGAAATGGGAAASAAAGPAAPIAAVVVAGAQVAVKGAQSAASTASDATRGG